MIHIITHVYAEQNKQFAGALAYQLSSLLLYPPENGVCIHVACVDSDADTLRVIKHFENDVNVKPHFMSYNQLGRRSIGRNNIAKSLSQYTDFVWFADADYFFGEGCLDAVAKHHWPSDCVAIFPRQVLISKTHDDGAAMLDKVYIDTKTVEVNPDDYVPKRYFRAIGGAQIVRGSIAGYGYLDGEKKWQRPTDKPFADTREDVYYRRELEKRGRIVGVDIPNCYRIRHLEGHPK